MVWIDARDPHCNQRKDGGRVTRSGEAKTLDLGLQAQELRGEEELR